MVGIDGCLENTETSELYSLTGEIVSSLIHPLGWTPNTCVGTALELDDVLPRRREQQLQRLPALNRLP